jgi:death-on-curing protein
MNRPIWLDKELLLGLQIELLARHGGLEGLRDPGLLESALAKPQQKFAYEDPDLFQLAASYAQGIAKNHPFLDGNKRCAFMSAYTFLGINGQQLKAPEEEAVVQTVALAAGEIDAEVYADWLRRNSVPVE